MNILHVVPSFAPCFSGGGVVNASYQIAKKQTQTGHNVTVYTTDSCKNRLKLNKNYNVDVDGIKVYYFKNISNTLKNSLTIDTPIALIRKLRNTINNFDVIHLHEHRHSLAIITHHYALKNNIPYVIQAHGSVLPFFQKEKLKEIFDRLWGFNILHDASKALALTEIEKKQYLKMGVKEENIEIVPLGINLEEYSNLPKKGNFRKKYGIEDNDKLLLFLGRIHEIKGLDLLIKSFNNINNEYVKLAIVGGDYGFLDKINSLIKEYNLKNKVILPGVLVGEDKKEALIDCDIFIMPSKYESFTTSGLEAMASYKPLILTKNNHIQEWVKDNVGLVCDYNEKSLGTSIEKLLNNNKLQKEFGKKGKTLIERKYNWNIIEKQLEDIYNKIVY